MVYISIGYYLFVAILFVLYYILPLRYRWTILLAGCLGFYYWLSKDSWWMFEITLVTSYLAGILIERSRSAASKRESEGGG